MKKFDVFCWAVVGLLLVFLWHSSSLEFFQDQITDASGNTTMGPIRGAPYSASDAVKIVAMMPATMKTALKASSGTDDPATLIAPITDLMSDFHGSVYLPATTPITTANVDTFLQSANVPTGLTKADVKTLMVAYFVNQRAGNPNAPLTAAQMAANAQQTVNAAATASNAAAYAAELAAVGQTGGYRTPNSPTGTSAPSPPSSPSGAVAPSPTGGYSSYGTPMSSNAPNPWGTSPGDPSRMSGMQVGGPIYGGRGAQSAATTSGNWASVGSNYPVMYGPSSKGTSLPNSNSGLVLPSAQQAGVDGDTTYMPGHRAPSQLGSFAPLLMQKMDGDPSGFWPDYRVFMK